MSSGSNTISTFFYYMCVLTKYLNNKIKRPREHNSVGRDIAGVQTHTTLLDKKKKICLYFTPRQWIEYFLLEIKCYFDDKKNKTCYKDQES